MNKLVIDRQRWARGGAPSGVRVCNHLLSSADGKMCCLGFCMAQMGASALQLLDIGEPHDAAESANAKDLFANLVKFEYREIDGDWDEEPTTEPYYADTDLTCDAMPINDDEKLTDEEREAKLAALFARHGIEVVFVDTPEETAALCGMPGDFGV